MKAKLLTALVVVLISLLTTSYAYACLTIDTVSINCPSANLGFSAVVVSDNENTQNIVYIQAIITPDKNSINIAVSNAYPNYQGILKYTIKNTGNYPIQFTLLTVTNSNPIALQITTTDHTGTLLGPSQVIQGATNIRVLSTAQENTVYTFKIQITAQAREPTRPHTVDFWKDRFQEQIYKGSQPKIDASTLEQYLNQISSQSKVFKFTGTRLQKFQQALNTLTLPNRASMESQLKAQLLALWLNQIAGWTQGYTIDGKSSQQVIQGSENALQNRQAAKYGTWRGLCERFNNLS
jgi:hypothetical protein